MKKLNTRSVIAAAAAGVLVAGGVVAPANAQIGSSNDTADETTADSSLGNLNLDLGSSEDAPAEEEDPETGTGSLDLESLTGSLGAIGGGTGSEEGEEGETDGSLDGVLDTASLEDLGDTSSLENLGGTDSLGGTVTITGSQNVDFGQVVPLALGSAALGIGVSALANSNFQLPAIQLPPLPHFEIPGLPVLAPAPAPAPGTAPQIDPALIAGAAALGLGAALVLAAGSSDGTNTGSDILEIDFTTGSQELDLSNLFGSLEGIDTESLNSISANGSSTDSLEGGIPTDSLDNVTSGSDDLTLPTGSLDNLTSGSDDVQLPTDSLDNVTSGSDEATLPTDSLEGNLNTDSLTGDNGEGSLNGGDNGEGSLGLNVNLGGELNLGSLTAGGGTDIEAGA